MYVGTACSFPKHLQMRGGISALREDQTYPAEPESSYGWSKLMGEYEAGLAGRSASISTGVLRLHNVYGPGVCFDRERSQVIPALIRKAVMHPGEPFTVWGSGRQYRDFLYVDDAVDALLLTREKGMDAGVIQAGTGHATSIGEIAQRIIGISGKQISLSFDESMPQGDRGRVAVCDRAREILGWSSRTDMETGLEMTYRWIRDRIESGNGPSGRAP